MAQPMRVLTFALFAVASVALADEKRNPGEPARPWKQQAGYRVLNLTSVPIVIDEPGRYALNRDWNLDLEAPGPGTLIRIVADNVSVDFRGFAIAFGNQGTGVAIDGDSVSMRNGALIGDRFVDSIASVGAETTIENMRIVGDLAVRLRGDRARVSNSSLGGRFGAVMVGDSIVAERNVLTCGDGTYCLEVGSNALVSNNHIGTGPDGAVDVLGDGSIFTDNIVGFRNAVAPVAFSVKGDGNVLRDNTVLVSGLDSSQVVFSVEGTRNVLEGNITAPQTSERGGFGISFSRDGNFHGDNRLGGVFEAIRPTGTVQTDWGGTVAF
jgi:hypothetical protein